MSEQWRRRSRSAFRFWEQVLTSWDEAPGQAGQYAELIAHLKRFERTTSDTFKYVLTRGADPVYLLHVLIVTCDEQRVRQAVGMPQVFTQSRSGSLEDLRDFHLVTDSDLRTMEAAVPALLRAGQPVDQEFLQSMRTRFEAMPEPPSSCGVKAFIPQLSSHLLHISPVIDGSRKGLRSVIYQGQDMIEQRRVRWSRAICSESMPVIEIQII